MKLMKLTSACVFSLCVLSGFAFAQSGASAPKPKVAVYVTGGKTPNENRALNAHITTAFFNSGRYVTIERSEAFLSQIDSELVAQRSGIVDDRQISQIGQQHGADLVCVGEMLEAFGSHQIAIRLINVETAEVLGAGVASGPLSTLEELAELSTNAAAAMIRGVDSRPYIFVDTRNQREYRVKRIGGRAWFLEDLVYDGKVFHSVAEAMAVCPAGWALPNDMEWEALALNASVNDIRDFARASNSAWWSSDASVNREKNRRVDYHIWRVRGETLAVSRTRDFVVREANVRCVQNWE